jgi:hypothetical protein
MYSLWTGDRRIFRPSNALLRVRRSEDLISFVLCIAVAFVGVMLLAQAVEHYDRAKTMAAWPTSIGRVTQANLEPLYEGSKTRWRPFVQSMYDVNGHTVISNGISMATARDVYSETDARAMITTYPPNTTVVVFYNPEHVTEAVLEHSLPRFAWLSLFAGLALIGAGSARLLMSYRVFWR